MLGKVHTSNTVLHKGPEQLGILVSVDSLEPMPQDPEAQFMAGWGVGLGFVLF